MTKQLLNNARYDKPGAYNRLWTFPHSTTAIAEAASYAVVNTAMSKGHTGAISIYAMPQIIFDANSGGQFAPIWRRFGREAALSELMDPHLIGPYVIAIPLDALREMGKMK